MSDFFAAAQFIEMSQDDKLSKPSFESYTAGYQLASEDFEMGEIVPEAAGLRRGRPGRGGPCQSCYGAARPTPTSKRRTAPTLAFGAAGRSPLRDRALDAARAVDRAEGQSGAGHRRGQVDARGQRRWPQLHAACGARRRRAPP